MGQRCRSSRPTRDWTKKEMMAYIDWDFEETERIEAQVECGMGNNSKEASRRGMGEIWQQAEEDTLAPAEQHS